MGVRKGYKLTDGREIPEDWDIVTLSDKCVKITKGTTPTTLGFAYVDYGIPFIKAESVSESGHILKEKVAYIDPKVHAILERSQLKTGDMLFSIAGVIGRVGTVTDSDVPANINQALALIRLQSDGNADPDYCYYCLSSQLIKEQIIDITVQAAQQNLSLGYVKNLKLPMPRGKKEQADIAVALGDADSLIDSLEALIEKKRLIKRGTMEELLTGKRRLAGFNDEWDNRKLGEVGVFYKGRGIGKDQARSGSTPCVRYGEIYTKHNDVIRAFYSWISEETASSATRLLRGDVLFAASGETKEDIGKSVAFLNNIEAYCGGDIIVMRSEKSDPVFLGYYLNTDRIRKQKSAYAQGDAIVHIHARDLVEITGLFPPKPEQSAIAQVLSDMDAEIEALEAKLEKARAIKRGMMEELLTGRIRLV